MILTPNESNILTGMFYIANHTVFTFHLNRTGNTRIYRGNQSDLDISVHPCAFEAELRRDELFYRDDSL